MPKPLHYMNMANKETATYRLVLAHQMSIYITVDPYHVQDRQQAVVSRPASSTLSSWSRRSEVVSDSEASWSMNQDALSFMAALSREASSASPLS